MKRVFLFAFSLVIFLMHIGYAQTVDLRKDYGTNSMEAAQCISKAIEKSQADPQAALQSIEAAIKADPQCPMAYYWHALIQENLGNIDECLASYKKAIELDKRYSNLCIDAAINLGITYGKLKKHDDAYLWFTQALIRDPGNQFKLRWKAYRNMAISLYEEKKYTSAAFAVIFAAQDNPEAIGESMVKDFLSKVDKDDVARLLYFTQEAPLPLAPRQGENTLQAVDLNGTAANEHIRQVLADVNGKFLLAFPAGVACYYSIATSVDPPEIRKVALPGPTVSACIAKDQLYAVMSNPARLEQLDIATGRSLKSWNLANLQPESIAVFPQYQLAYFTDAGAIKGLNLKNGEIFSTDMAGEQLLAHPSLPFLFASETEEEELDVDSIPLYGGFLRPMPLSSLTRAQTTLNKYLVVPDNLLLAELRMNVGVNCNFINMSPDGNWVSVTSKGGWQPMSPQPKTGNGVPVFSTGRLDAMLGFFPTPLAPVNTFFNPVSGQLAVIRLGEIRLFHPSTPNNVFNIYSDPRFDPQNVGKPVPPGLPVNYSGNAAWSSSGEYLAVAAMRNGLFLFRNTLTADEKAAGTAWAKRLPALDIPMVASVTPQTAAVAEPVKLAAAFALPTENVAVAQMLNLAMQEGRTLASASWKTSPLYAADKDTRNAMIAAETGVNTTGNRGISIFQMREALKRYPKLAPAKYLLAEGLRQTGQLKEAQRYFIEAVQDDAGRTEVSCQALNSLAFIFIDQQVDQNAFYCLGLSLYLDRSNPDAMAMTTALMEKYKMDEALKRLRAAAPAAGPVGKLPVLRDPDPAARVYNATELFQAALGSVVRIESGDRNGSGVCIGEPGIIVTNDHVIAPNQATWVIPFTSKDGKPVALPKVAVDIIYRSTENDIAVLRMRTVAAGMKALDVVAAQPAVGEKTYAIGSPGMGAQILEQSFSEGIVSALERTIDGKTYLQHSAAVNPGNSGGPLLNARGQLLGIVTLKASLENVSFAIPWNRIRAAFSQK